MNMGLAGKTISLIRHTDRHGSGIGELLCSLLIIAVMIFLFYLASLEVSANRTNREDILKEVEVSINKEYKMSLR
jgi:hypothetical protein